jgi:NADH dehydrogenase
MNDRLITVFGGTGFLGRRVVRHLRTHGFSVRIASRHLDRGLWLFGQDDPRLHSVAASIDDDRSVAEAVTGAYGVVNTVSLYVEHGQQTFQLVHVESAQRVAAQAQRAGVKRLVHVSGIGANASSQSPYIRKRGEGELAVRGAFADALIVRPGVMFGLDDAFLAIILQLLRRFPLFPMFGQGQTRLQPAYVEDVAEAVARSLQKTEARGITYELGGPRVYSYEEFLKTVAREADLKPILIPFPFIAWHAAARISEMLPSPPITQNQVELMQVDSVCDPKMPGFGDLDISPQSVEPIIKEILRGR